MVTFGGGWSRYALTEESNRRNRRNAPLGEQLEDHITWDGGLSPRKWAAVRPSSGGDSAGLGPAGDGRGHDRRTLIAKAAVAGGIVWTTPAWRTVAAAAASCTPKCAAADFGLFSSNVQAFDVCNPGGTTAYPSVPHNVTKAAEFSFSLSALTSSCPCSSNPSTAQVVLGTVPTSWDKVNSCADDFGSEYAQAANSATDANKFLLYKSGSLGNGIYVPDGLLCLSARCTDRFGNDVYKRCTFKICLDYSPAGACETFSTVSISAIQIGDCEAGCDPCS